MAMMITIILVIVMIKYCSIVFLSFLLADVNVKVVFDESKCCFI